MGDVVLSNDWDGVLFSNDGVLVSNDRGRGVYLMMWGWVAVCLLLLLLLLFGWVCFCLYGPFTCILFHKFS